MLFGQGGGLAMLTIYTEDHRLQDGKSDLIDGVAPVGND
jgi:hypothetical protein